MITLLQIGGGAANFTVEGHKLAPDDWLAIKSSAERLLLARQCTAAAELLNSAPWELRKGTNGFGDDFDVLYHELPLTKFVEVRVDEPDKNAALRQIANALSQLRHPVRFIGVDLKNDSSPAPVTVPEALPRSEVVGRALNDAEAAILAGRPESAVDRAHTALHGYLKEICSDRGVAAPDECDSIPRCLAHLRDKDPAFVSTQQDEAIRLILRSLISVAGSFNGIRNHASLAHPGDGLLRPAEAMLCINAMRTLLRYVHDKTSP
jgi:hypothetical protein